MGFFVLLRKHSIFVMINYIEMKTKILLLTATLALNFSLLTLNYNAQWQQTSLNSGYINCFTISGNNIFAGSNNGMYLSSNNGNSWMAINTGLLYEYGVMALVSKADTVFAGTWGTGVYKSTTNGSSWTAVNTGLSNVDVWSLAISGDTIFAGTSGGVFLSFHNGSSWVAANHGLPSSIEVDALALKDTSVFAGT